MLPFDAPIRQAEDREMRDENETRLLCKILMRKPERKGRKNHRRAFSFFILLFFIITFINLLQDYSTDDLADRD